MVVVGALAALTGIVPVTEVPSGPPPYVPCPVVELDPPPPRFEPPQPPPPHRDGDRYIGGPGMATTGLVVAENAPPLPDNLSATAWLVADLDTGAVYAACAPHEYRIPASTQKLLLALTLLDKLDPAQEVEVTWEDMQFEPGSSAVGLLVGGRYTVETLWLGLLLNSGNDAANVLARVGGGERGVAGTLAEMNRTAALLGAHQTWAVTPSGLDGPGQFTSAYDLALIARALFAREDFRRYATTPRTRIPAQPPQDPNGFEIQNQNPLLDNYPGFLGGKTGYTDLARHSFVGAAERDGRRLVVTVLGAENRPVPAAWQAAALLDWGFSLRRPQPVGWLVEPGEVQVSLMPDVAPTVPEPDPAPEPAPPLAGSPVPPVVTWSLRALAGLGLAVFTVALLLMAARPFVHRRPRPTSLP